MCGRIFLFSTVQDIKEEFNIDVSDIDRIKPRYNIAPTQDVVVVADGRLTTMRWGLVPHWAKDEKIGNRLINARAETIAIKPAFRSSFKERRCIVVADGFYEWKKGVVKQPFAVSHKGRRPMALAGVWDEWTTPHKTLRSVAIITTEANKVMQPMHERMPVVLEKKHRQEWLEGEDIVHLQQLLKPNAADDLVAYKVSPDVNSPAHDSKKNIEPLH